MKLSRARLAALAVGGLLATLPASAEATMSDPVRCSAPTVFTALASYGDFRSYFIAPGGDFETSRWTLAGGAGLTLGSGPLRLGGARASLRLPPGASATSPVFCVDLDYPTMRFFSAQRTAGSSSKLSVDVIYPALARIRPQAAIVSGTAAWTLARDVRLRPELVDRAGGWRYVQLRFSADRASGDWRVDDVLVDPRMRG